MKLVFGSLCLSVLFFSNLVRAQNFDNVTIKTTQLSEQVYMLVGAGGNIGLLVGDDGVFMVDSQFHFTIFYSKNPHHKTN